MSVSDLPIDPARARRERRRFHAALALFLLWVAALGTLALLTGRKPAQNPAGIERR